MPAGGTQVLPCTASPSQGLLLNSLDLSFPFPKEGQVPPKSGNNMERGENGMPVPSEPGQQEWPKHSLYSHSGKTLAFTSSKATNSTTGSACDGPLG